MKKEISTTQSPAQAHTRRESTRYSDRDLHEFKGIVNTKLEEARADYEMLREAISGSNDNGTDDTSPNFRLVEDVSGFFSREEMAQLAFRRSKYIEQLQNALVRIENKTFGVCRVTGKLIPKERLRAVPTTTLSMDAKAMVADGRPAGAL
jgi:DnaK suppressor protein